MAYAIVIQFLYGSHPFIAYSDAESFIRVAENFILYGVFSESYSAPFVLESLRTPGYPFFLAFLLWANVPFMGIAVIQNFFTGIAAVLIYRLGKNLFYSGFAGAAAAVIFSLEPVSIYWSNLLMSDSLFAFLFIAALYLFVANRLYWFAAVLGLAVLVRPIGLYFFPLFLIAFFARRYFEPKPLNTLSVVKKALIAVFIFLAVIFPWFLRNKIVFDTWAFSSAGWVNMTIFTLAEFGRQQQIPIMMPHMTVDYPWRDAAYADDMTFDRDLRNTGFYKNQFYQIVFSHPWEYFKFHIGSAVKIFNYHGYRYLTDEVIKAKLPWFKDSVANFAVSAGKILWLAVYGFAVFGLWKGETRFWQVFFAVIILVNNLLLGDSGLMQGGRYGLPVMPIMLLLAGYGIWIFKKSFAT